MPRFKILEKLPTLFGKTKPVKVQIAECEKAIRVGALLIELVNSEGYQKGLAPLLKEVQNDCITKLRHGKNPERMSGMLDCIDLIMTRINEKTIKAASAAELLTKLKDK